MKYPKTLISILFMILFMPVTLKAEIESDSAPIDLRLPHYTIITYTYDDAGNVIQKSYRHSMFIRENDADEDYYQLIDDSQIYIVADENWGNVSISILGDLDNIAAILSIFDMSGIRYFTKKLDNNYTTINLSSLTRGIYLFHFSINGTTKNYKIIKR